jgi:hypothetical protein
MRFYSDIEATLGVWYEDKMLRFYDGVYDAKDQKEIEFLKKAGYRHDPEKVEKKPVDKQQGK